MRLHEASDEGHVSHESDERPVSLLPRVTLVTHVTVVTFKA